MFDIDYIIPCYGKSEIIEPGLMALAIQWHKEFIHVTLVNDCSPNTDCDYQDLVDKYKNYLDIRCIRTPENYGQGLARQYGIDHTEHQYFMLQDEDDRLANPLAVSIYIGCVESNIYKQKPDGNSYVYELDKNGDFIIDKSKPPIAIVSGPLFEFDDNHTHVITANNRIWLNSKLYNRSFLNKHNIRFNEAQSRHAEDYYFMSCFFYALDNDSSYSGILLDDNQIMYLWYPNSDSQSRIDPHYSFMLSGYTMDGSSNILHYMKDINTNKLEWGEEQEEQYKNKLLNMTMYSYFTFLAFINHVKTTDYVPKLELDWTILRDACNKLRLQCLEYFDQYTYSQKNNEYFGVTHYTDVNFIEPWVEFDAYIKDGCEELTWTYDELLAHKVKH